MERLDFETLFRIVRWDYNRCFKDESLDKDLFMGKYGKVMGEHYYNKFVHEFDGNILKMVGYFRGSEKEGQVLSRKNPNIEKGKLNFIRYSEMKNWSVRELFGEDLEQADRALINKVYHMLFDIGSDFESVIRMLYSFRNGPKSGIKVADPEDNYEWTNKDGNEKYSTKNLPKAHFRWDWRRYTLSKESVDKITEFVDTILES